MSDLDAGPNWTTLEEAVLKLQKSTRRTVPMFGVGIVATLIAAGIAIYYIFTLSGDLGDARAALRQSQDALAQARANLATVGTTLRQTQTTGNPAQAGAGPIAGAISTITRSQNSIEMASTSVSAATAKITPDANSVPNVSPGAIGSCLLTVRQVTYLTGGCQIQLLPGGSFTIHSTDGTGPVASVRRQDTAAVGTWQSAPNQPPEDLGILQRQNACWSNDVASVCAWK